MSETERQLNEEDLLTLDPPEEQPVDEVPPGDPDPEHPDGEEEEVPVLPLPELPMGAVLVTFQANLPNMMPTTAVIAPRMTQKMLRRVSDSGRMVDGVFVPTHAGMTQMFMNYVSTTLFSELNARYPDADPEIAELEARLTELKLAQMSKLEFIGSGA